MIRINILKKHIGLNKVSRICFWIRISHLLFQCVKTVSSFLHLLLADHKPRRSQTRKIQASSGPLLSSLTKTGRQVNLKGKTLTTEGVQTDLSRKWSRTVIKDYNFTTVGLQLPHHCYLSLLSTSSSRRHLDWFLLGCVDAGAMTWSAS